MGELDVVLRLLTYCFKLDARQSHPCRAASPFHDSNEVGRELFPFMGLSRDKPSSFNYVRFLDPCFLPNIT